MYDVIVVGAGVEGSSTAYHLAKRGKNVLLLEQFTLSHNRGSSHGQTRTTRKAYGEKEYYTIMMDESYKLMEVLEQESGEKLFSNCGILTMGDAKCDWVAETAPVLKKHGVPHETFGVDEQRRRFPKIQTPDNYGFVLDHTGGVLRADKVLRAIQKQFVANGGTIKDNEPMKELIPGQVVTVKTTKREFRGQSVVLAMGPWTAKYLPKLGLNLPLKPELITVCYWKEGTPGEFYNYPAFYESNACGEHGVYGIPPSDNRQYFKICLHWGPKIDPDHIDNVDNTLVINTLKQYIAKRFPSIQLGPVLTETCIYTNTPDEDLILDTHPQWKNIIIAAGFSGHGFKLAPVVGKVLADMAVGQVPSYEMKHFRINRFVKHKL